MKTLLATTLVAASTLATVAGAQDMIVPSSKAGGSEMGKIFANEPCGEVVEIMSGAVPEEYGGMAAALLFYNAFIQSQPPDLGIIMETIREGCEEDPSLTAVQILSSQ